MQPSAIVIFPTRLPQARFGIFVSLAGTWPALAARGGENICSRVSRMLYAAGNSTILYLFVYLWGKVVVWRAVYKTARIALQTLIS